MSKLPTLMVKTESDEKPKKIEDVFDLTHKEVEVMEQVSLGLNNKEIAAELFLSEGTVRNYISTILEKLDLRDRTQLAIFYLTKYK